MHCTVQGQGPPLLFIHGWAMHAGVWAEFAPLFAGRFRTIAVDLPGHGASCPDPGPFSYDGAAAAIVDVARSLAKQSIAAAGWSMGASILMKAQALAPELFTPVVYISANPSLVNRPDYSCGIPEAAVKRLYRQVARDYPAGLRYFYDLLLTMEEKKLFGATALYGAMTDTGCAPGKDAALAFLDCLMREDQRPELVGSQTPTLVLHGAEDGICNPEAAGFMHSRLAGSRLELLPHTGHAPFLTRRDDCAAAMLDFLGCPS